jgi:hypothetical protein
VYNWKKGIASWQVGKTLYISVPFTWLVADAEKMAERHKGKVVMGGPGFMKPSECEGFIPLMFHNPLATVTSRGCPNSCPFCAVKLIEPDFSEDDDYRPAPVICDNNWTATSWKHQVKTVEKQKIFPLTDFNQGLEASKFTPKLADLLGTIRCKVRFAFDNWKQETAVADAIKLCKERTTRDISVYCLIGYKDTPEDAKARLEQIRAWGAMPNAMRYQPLDATEKNSYVAPGWTERELNDMGRYYNRLAWLKHIPFEEYRVKTEQLSLID